MSGFGLVVRLVKGGRCLVCVPEPGGGESDDAGVLGGGIFGCLRNIG